MAVADYFPFLFKKTSRFVTETGADVYGMIAEYETPAAIYHAAERIRDAGYRQWDVYAPFPIHGIDEAMGVRRTILPVMVAAGAFTGAGLALLMQWWMSAADYPLVVQGKPYGAWEPFVPIVFELGVLLSAFTTLIGMLALNGLPRLHHPLFRKDRFLRVSDDRFIVCIEAEDAKFDPAATRALLESSGGRNIDLVEE